MIRTAANPREEALGATKLSTGIAHANPGLAQRIVRTWGTTHGDRSDFEWELIADNQGAIAVIDLLHAKTKRFAKTWNDAGFKTTFTRHCRDRHIAAETVNRIHPHAFAALPRRWVVEPDVR